MPKFTWEDIKRLQTDNPDIKIETDGPIKSDKVDTLVHLEWHMQQAVFDIVFERALSDNRYAYIYANVNGQYRPGQRKEPGLIAGIPDIFVAYPVDAVNTDGTGKHYCGMYLELKRKGNKPTKEQEEYLDKFTRVGYYCYVAYSVQEAIEAIENYLNGKVV